MKHPSAYEGRTVVILGLAKSGRAVAEVMHRAGANVIASDRKPRDQCPEADALEAMGVTVICGEHPDDLIHADVALLVKNPGIPYTSEPVVKAMSLGIDVVTEIEVAYKQWPGPMIGITGSNGKTTTTSWIGDVMDRAGLSPIIAGNIGTPLCEAVTEVGSDQWIVVELSSFQLMGTVSFRPKLAVLLNVVETHLDYHGTMDDYIAAKKRLLLNQGEDDITVFNWDDHICRQMITDVRSQLIPFSMKEKLSYGVFIEEDWIVYRQAMSANIERIASLSTIGMRGAFNIENALAMVAVAMQLEIMPDQIATSLRQFAGVEHRLEFVRTWQDIQFYNNSKSTNPTSTIKALHAFTEPIVLIAGGQMRGTSFESLLPAFKERLKGLVTLGAAKDELYELGQQARIPLLKTIPELADRELALAQAVKTAYEFAAPGDVVLLSPACASWDMFTSYEERGCMFKQAVHTLR